MIVQLSLERQLLRSIELTAEQSASLNEEAGEDYGAKFIVLSRDTHPGDPQSWRAWLIPCTARQADAAIRGIEKAMKTIRTNI